MKKGETMKLPARIRFSFLMFLGSLGICLLIGTVRFGRYMEISDWIDVIWYASFAFSFAYLTRLITLLQMEKIKNG